MEGRQLGGAQADVRSSSPENAWVGGLSQNLCLDFSGNKISGVSPKAQPVGKVNRSTCAII